MKTLCTNLIIIILVTSLIACQSGQEKKQNRPIFENEIINLPKSYTLIETIKGDLNKDKKEDFVFLVEKKQVSFNQGRFGIMVYLSSDTKYKLTCQNFTLFRDNKRDGYLSTDEISLDIKNNLLHIYNNYRCQNARNLEITTFRWQNKGFYVIGFDKNILSEFVYEKEPDGLFFDMLSMNFLTHKKQTKSVIAIEEKTGKEIYQEKWENLAKKRLLKLEDIKEFEYLDLQNLYTVSIKKSDSPKEIRNSFWEKVNNFSTFITSSSEDASSTFYTKFYHNGKHPKLIRSIWNGGLSNPPSVSDFYFKNGELILVEEYQNKILAGKWKDVDSFEKNSNSSQKKSYILQKNKIISAYFRNKKIELETVEIDRVIKQVLANKKLFVHEFNEKINQ